MNVKTGVYHAGVDDYEKERIHVDWRKGTVKCVLLPGLDEPEAPQLYMRDNCVWVGYR